MRAAKLLKAHDQLILAHDETDAGQQVTELKNAKDIINSTSPLGPIRQRAIDDINAALRELKDGDPNHGVKMYIERANRTLGF